MARMAKLGWLRGVVLGLDDGLVTTLVTVMTVSGIVGTHLLTTMVGVVAASSISMGLGGYAAARSVQDQNEWIAGLETGGAFLVGGLAPLLPVALHLPCVQWWSYACTAIVALLFGWVKAHYADNEHNAIRSALFFLTIVTIGTLVGVFIGLLLQ
jgi:VIT1/CCC1 family predicted Fe2+/Mn2+ transporter